jgi:hypothetical protein
VIILVSNPLPLAPMCVAWRASAVMIGRVRSTSSASPPTNIASIPSAALGGPPETGASIQPMPCSRRRRLA